MHLPPSHCRQRHTRLIFLLESALGVLRHASSALPLPPAAHTAHLLAGERPWGPQACVFRPPTAASCTQGSSSCWRAHPGSSGMHLPHSHWRQRHTGLNFLLKSPPRVLRHASSALPLAPAAHRAHLLCWRAPLESSGMHHPPSHCLQRHTGLIFLLESALGVLRHASSALPLPPRHTRLIFLLESALGVLRHASSALPLPPAAHRAHLLAGERPQGPQACIFRPPTAASSTPGTSSCWRAPSGSSGMHLLASHCRQLHTGHIFLLESPLGVLRHASSALPLPPAAHRAHLLAGEPTQGPQACIFRTPTGASGTQGSSSLLESAIGVLRHASSALPLPPAAHRAHLLAGERPWGS